MQIPCVSFGRLAAFGRSVYFGRVGVTALLVAAAMAADPVGPGQQVAVNDYTGAGWSAEPVSFDVAPTVKGLERDGTPVSCQSETIPGCNDAHRLWTLVDLPKPGQLVYDLRDHNPIKHKLRGPIPAAPVRGLGTVILHNSAIQVRVVAESRDFGPAGVPSFQVPGPVVAIRHASLERWVGDSWLESRGLVRSIKVTTESGPVFQRFTMIYTMVDGRVWTARVRVWQNAQPYAEIIEDCDLGGDARWVFDCGDLPARRHLPVCDGGVKSQPVAFVGPDWHPEFKEYSQRPDNIAGDFIAIEGQNCLARLVVWTQFGYFGGKNETLGVFADDDSLFVGGFAIRVDRWTRAKVNHVDLYRRPMVPGRPDTRGALGLAGAEPRTALEAWLVAGHREWGLMALPPRDRESEAIMLEHRQKSLDGQIQTVIKNAPNQKTGKALEPQVQAERLAGLRQQLARLPSEIFVYPTFLPKANVKVGTWNLDRLNRLPTVWNADGSPVAIADQVPKGGVANGEWIGRVINGLGFRNGHAVFNGSDTLMRGGLAGWAATHIAWAKANPNIKAANLEVSAKMAGWVIIGAMVIDEATYPGRRAMLPWTDPEALNPFYQGMENMNFNADRYVSAAAVGAALAAMGHPFGKEIIEHARDQLSLSLGRYVYPDSGCWEESHGYCGHTIKNTATMSQRLRDLGVADFFNDRRFAQLFGFWALVHSPRDRDFNNARIVPPIGDHGLARPPGIAGMISGYLPDFAKSQDPAIQKIVGELAWLVDETRTASVPAAATPATATPAAANKVGSVSAPAPTGTVAAGTVAAGPAPVPWSATAPALVSRYLQGYGATLRQADAAGRESYLVVRAEQSWGHHHEDKGSLWGWFRNVHFFGDAAWGGPPGGTYFNPYKQGPASGTQIEFVGVKNGPFPCKYPAPWIHDDAYGKGADTGIDYVCARCEYPFNPDLDLSASGPEARRIGYDRQVLLIHGGLLVVRDNIESTVPTIWRMHSYQPDGTVVNGASAVLTSKHGVRANLRILSPATGVALTTTAVDDLNINKEGKKLLVPFGSVGKDGWDTRSMVLRWDMPINTPATWTMTVQGQEAAVTTSVSLEPGGRVVKSQLDDGSEVITLMNGQPFTWTGEGIDFAGTVGVVVRHQGRTTTHALRATRLSAQ